MLVRRETGSMFGNDHICYLEAILPPADGKSSVKKCQPGNPDHKARFGNSGLDSLIAHYGLKSSNENTIVCAAPTVF
jgi:hypothetical protein